MASDRRRLEMSPQTCKFQLCKPHTQFYGASRTSKRSLDGNTFSGVSLVEAVSVFVFANRPQLINIKMQENVFIELDLIE